jgi:hypothetical protein
LNTKQNRFKTSADRLSNCETLDISGKHLTLLAKEQNRYCAPRELATSSSSGGISVSETNTSHTIEQH